MKVCDDEQIVTVLADKVNILLISRLDVLKVSMITSMRFWTQSVNSVVDMFIITSAGKTQCCSKCVQNCCLSCHIDALQLVTNNAYNLADDVRSYVLTSTNGWSNADSSAAACECNIFCYHLSIEQYFSNDIWFLNNYTNLFASPNDVRNILQHTIATFSAIYNQLGRSVSNQLQTIHWIHCLCCVKLKTCVIPSTMNNLVTIDLWSCLGWHLSHCSHDVTPLWHLWHQSGARLTLLAPRPPASPAVFADSCSSPAAAVL